MEFHREMKQQEIETRGVEPPQAAIASRRALGNESMARRYWPNENPVGRSFIAGSGFHSGPLQVVGVVKDARTMALDLVEPLFYQPIQAGKPPKLLLRSTGSGTHEAVSAIV